MSAMTASTVSEAGTVPAVKSTPEKSWKPIAGFVNAAVRMPAITAWRTEAALATIAVQKRALSLSVRAARRRWPLP